MPPCKGHKKSRAGCQVCKRRHIKCDESRPSCRNCTRHGVRCDYAGRAPVDDSDSSSTSPASTLRQDSPQLEITARPIRKPSDSASCTCSNTHTLPSNFPGTLPPCTLTTHLRNPPAPSPLSIADLNLLHHFTISTALTYSNEPHIRHLWSHTIPKLGETHPFVLHAILAAAAAHQNTPASIPLAREHHHAALTLMRPHLININDSNCHPLFAAAMSNILYSISRRERPLTTTWTTGIRAGFGILHQSWPWVRRGPIAPLITPSPNCKPNPKHVSAATETQLATLQRLSLDPALPEPEELEDAITAAAYFVAARNLRSVYAALEMSPITPDTTAAMMMQFVLRTPQRFWECLENRKGRALVLYAWYCVGWEAVGMWWAEGRAECDLEMVEGAIGTEWGKWVVGAREVLKGLKGGEVMVTREGVGLEEGVGEGPDDWIKEMLEMGMVRGDWQAL